MDARTPALTLALVDGQGGAVPFPVGGRDPRFVAVDSRGAFTLRDAPAGSFRLRAGVLAELRQGRFRREIELELTAGEGETVGIEGL